MTEQDLTTSNAGVEAGTHTPAAPASRVDRVDRGSRVTVTDASRADGTGSTTIAEGVVAKVAGIAAREVNGVYALGGGGARTLGAIRDAINATDLTQGVKVEVGETQAAVDITLVVEYPAPIQAVAAEVRAAVTRAITQLVGLEVVEVNIAVDDVHLPNVDDDNDHNESRVS
ncbi:Asp23/Gls24 family envelope stress response protein [Pseudoclavibacter chungangensis]|uniref:Asp23/Gls24 family envelope stress response protein n=1 Tax=Pseudoclavibacter chungangensis TaxID=587635 RepID=A0A7J5BNE3_9MICO|nr:Asp23/Gls24 family envelope stress response protein [Pseudoclavibacter chungangensis]KAB1653618.1 Asp23/Gls24 family envelope stress response protein [Pseudoclavibacter chungangensis]NYJ68724.1 putative alkaline shock family protein YloU [Pseudoclavibacter chungangensis]